MLAASRARIRGRGRAHDRLRRGTHLVVPAVVPAPAGPRARAPMTGHQVRLLWQLLAQVWVVAFQLVIWFPTCFAPSTCVAWFTAVVVYPG